MAFLQPRSPFSPPTISQTLLTTPLRFALHSIYRIVLYVRGPAYRPPANGKAIKVVCISDTHCKSALEILPAGDLLVHAGDLTNLGTRAEMQRQIDWLKSIHNDVARGGFVEIVVVGGNHDSYLDGRSRSGHDRRHGRRLDWGPVRYLQRSSAVVTIHGRSLNVYGAPQIPRCGGGRDFAFQYRRGQDAWTGTVPDDVDVLVTHTPPKTHLDLPLGPDAGLGCEWLLRECWRVRPSLHVFGHVHAGHGSETVWWDELQFRYERICSRAPGRLGAVGELLDLSLWLQAFSLLYEAVKVLLWVRLWGGAAAAGGGGVMVNASLTWQTTDRLDNDPVVVYL